VVGGEIALADNSLGDAARHLQYAVAAIPVGGTPALISARAYAAVLERQNRTDDAVRVLQEATENPVRAFQNVGNPLTEWVQTRVQLVELLKRVGREADADAMAAPLSKMLSLADSDVTLLRRLTR
jgi:hypothetical protein